jgi:hypothetical protein
VKGKKNLKEIFALTNENRREKVRLIIEAVCFEAGRSTFCRNYSHIIHK